MGLLDRLKTGLGALSTIDIVTFLLAVAGLALGAVTFVLTAGLGAVQVLATVVVGATAVLFGLLIGKALTGVAKTALYVYATEETAPPYFEDIDFGELGGDSSRGTGGLRTRLGDSTGGRS